METVNQNWERPGMNYDIYTSVGVKRAAWFETVIYWTTDGRENPETRAAVWTSIV